MKKILLSIVMMSPAAAWGQEIQPLDIKAGLWESTTTSQMSGMSTPSNMPQITPEQLAKMPPDMRARVEGMMKGGPGAPQTRTTKVCYTSEQLSKPLFDTGDKGCSYKLKSSFSGGQAIHVECARGNTNTTGDVNLKRVDAEHLTADLLLKTSGDSSTNGSVGQNVTIKMSISNKFISSDCGDVKPVDREK